MQVTDQHLEDPDTLYRYRVVFDDTLKYDQCRRTLNQMYGYGWDVRRTSEMPNAHWAMGMFYRAWTIYVRGEEELVALGLIQ